MSEKELPPLPEPLPHPVIDSHTHLDSVTEMTGLPATDAIAQASRVNVTGLVQVGCDLPSARWAVEVAQAHPEVVATVAIHPNEVARLGALELADALDHIDHLATAPRVRAVGETGLDYYRTPDPAAQQRQRDAFGAHIAIARERGLALVIHDRDAHADILTVLDAAGVPDRVVMHCFSGDAEFARQCLDRNAWLSFAGPITYKANEHLREALRIAPLDRILVETDAPYLVPVPWRGRPNAPHLIPHTARFIAETRGEDLETVCAALYVNAHAAFGGAW